MYVLLTLESKTGDSEDKWGERSEIGGSSNIFTEGSRHAVYGKWIKKWRFKKVFWSGERDVAGGRCKSVSFLSKQEINWQSTFCESRKKCCKRQLRDQSKHQWNQNQKI